MKRYLIITAYLLCQLTYGQIPLKYNGQILKYNGQILKTNNIPLDSNLTMLTSLFNNNESNTGKVLYVNITINGDRYCVVENGNNNCIIFPIRAPSYYINGGECPEFDSYYQGNIIGCNIGNSNLTFGGTWSTNTGVSYIGGSYKSTTVAGRYIECTTPDGVTEVGVWDLGDLETAVAIVSINGDNTLANQLPTAQELVDNSKLESTTLVANGGTLNPTDRIYLASDASVIITTTGLWLGANNRRVLLANNLTPGLYTIRITKTGYRPVGGSSDNIRIIGFFHNAPDISLSEFPLTSEIEYVDNPITASPGISDNNFAFAFRPNSAIYYDWIGHSGSQYLTSGGVYVDNVLVSNSTSVTGILGDSIEIRVTGYCLHDETGSTHVAEYTQNFKWKINTWLENNITFEWLVTGKVGTGYTPMLGCSEYMNKASIYNDNEDYQLSQSGAEVYYGNINSSCGYIWDEDGNWATIIYSPDDEYTVPYIIQWADRETDNKLYYIYYDNDSIHAGDVFERRILYKWKYFNDADLILGR